MWHKLPPCGDLLAVNRSRFAAPTGPFEATTVSSSVSFSAAAAAAAAEKVGGTEKGGRGGKERISPAGIMALLKDKQQRKALRITTRILCIITSSSKLTNFFKKIGCRPTIFEKRAKVFFSRP